MLLPVSCGQDVSSVERFDGSFLDAFDTVTTIIGYAESADEFSDTAEDVRSVLMEYHRLYDIYNTYEGINNLKTVNDNAGKAAVKVDERIISLLEFCKEMYYETDGKVNVCMGSVLRLWHDERTNALEYGNEGKIPKMDSLRKASLHTDIEKLIIDRENSTVYLADENMSLDVGAVAKGYATQMLRASLGENTVVSVGGNVISTGPKKDGEKWSIGIQDPFDQSASSHTVAISDEAVVSSGIYQRNYVADGKVYHHLIDPATLMPGEKYAAVTVIAHDSGICDALSTALFLMDISEGEELLGKYDAEAMWIFADGEEYFSDGYEKYVK